MARLIDAEALMETWNLGNATKYGNITEEDQAAGVMEILPFSVRY